MKKGRVLCLSGICLIAVAFVLALSGAHACTVLDPTELADIYGGACDEICYAADEWGCAGLEYTGQCDPQEGNCPDEQMRESCHVKQYECALGPNPPYPECTEFDVDCTDWYRLYQCEKDNYIYLTCYWRPGQKYPCWDRDPNTWQKCEDGS
jgi:hypothetical protein